MPLWVGITRIRKPQIRRVDTFVEMFNSQLVEGSEARGKTCQCDRENKQQFRAGDGHGELNGQRRRGVQCGLWRPSDLRDLRQ